MEKLKVTMEDIQRFKILMKITAAYLTSFVRQFLDFSLEYCDMLCQVFYMVMEA